MSVYPIRDIYITHSGSGIFSEVLPWFLAYFTEMKVCLSDHQSACPSPTNNF
jgi:hypothetical protein